MYLSRITISPSGQVDIVFGANDVTADRHKVSKTASTVSLGNNVNDLAKANGVMERKFDALQLAKVKVRLNDQVIYNTSKEYARLSDSKLPASKTQSSHGRSSMKKMTLAVDVHQTEAKTGPSKERESAVFLSSATFPDDGVASPNNALASPRDDVTRQVDAPPHSSVGGPLAKSVVARNTGQTGRVGPAVPSREAATRSDCDTSRNGTSCVRGNPKVPTVATKVSTGSSVRRAADTADPVGVGSRADLRSHEHGAGASNEDGPAYSSGSSDGDGPEDSGNWSTDSGVWERGSDESNSSRRGRCLVRRQMDKFYRQWLKHVESKSGERDRSRVSDRCGKDYVLKPVPNGWPQELMEWMDRDKERQAVRKDAQVQTHSRYLLRPKLHTDDPTKLPLAWPPMTDYKSAVFFITDRHQINTSVTYTRNVLLMDGEEKVGLVYEEKCSAQVDNNAESLDLLLAMDLVHHQHWLMNRPTIIFANSVTGNFTYSGVFCPSLEAFIVMLFPHYRHMAVHRSPALLAILKSLLFLSPQTEAEPSVQVPSGQPSALPSASPPLAKKSISDRRQ